jgi:hypothetical protein
MKKLVIFIMSLILLFATIVYADCEYNGVLYPTGTVIDGKTCQADGTWR